MTATELTEMIDRVVEERDLYERIQRARELRLKLAPLVCDKPAQEHAA
jgi:hypothetical protein